MQQSLSEKALTVTELSRRIKLCIETRPDLTSVWVKGEISGLTLHSSGHIYFTLKDKDSIIQAAFFKNANTKLRFKMAEGQSVIALGSISVYEKRGNYQLIVSDLLLDGMGEIQQKIEELKKKLSAEGLFAAERKQPIPFLPRRIGIATSPTGAAFRDIIKVALRRYPNLEIVLAPAKVQGDDAPATIVRAIEELNKEHWKIDTIIAGRGGGSTEDLLPFSDETVVRAFAASRVPIISAVGHQIDHPLCDDAADYAAPTPSAAAEYAIPDKGELEHRLTINEGKLKFSLQRILERRSKQLEALENRRVFTTPKSIFTSREIDLDHLTDKLGFAAREIISQKKQLLIEEDHLSKEMRLFTRNATQKLGSAAAALENLSPLGTLKRGYAVMRDERQRTVKSVDMVKASDTVSILVSDGEINCTVLSAQKGEPFGKEEKEK